MTDTLSPAGSSSYDSNTMVVGDGTWDSSRNDFLLPNLVGLNFATMQYNGMGNRFRGLPEYHTLIIGHGAVAAITFLLIIPSAIFIARFYFRNPRLALRLHIYLQILTVFLSTVVLILGWFAVGPERSLTNPHHGIGVAIYVLIIVQALGGGLIHRIEKGKQRWRVPLKLVVSRETYGELQQLTLNVATPMARKSDCTLRRCPSSTWPYTIWIAQSLVRALRRSSISVGAAVLCAHIHLSAYHL